MIYWIGYLIAFILLYRYTKAFTNVDILDCIIMSAIGSVFSWLTVLFMLIGYYVTY